MTIDGLLMNAKVLRQDMDSGRLTREVLMRHGEHIVEQQRIQLFMGKGSDGEDLHPFYSEDVKPSGYFKSGAAAKAYAAWKQTIAYPYTVRRNPDTGYAANIMQKYGFGVFGLCPMMWDVIWNDWGAKDELIEEMRNVLWQ